MSQKRIIQTFEQYQKSRVQFVQAIAEFSTQKQNTEILQNAGVMSHLKPLLLDVVPTIQQTAALAMGRLANYKRELAEAIVKENVLTHLVYSLAEQNRFYKRAAAFVLRAIAKHSAELAREVVRSGAVDALVIGLEEFDPAVKEGSACALGYVSRHNCDLAQTVVDAGAVPLLVLCVQEPELSLKRAAASALADIAMHSNELAQAVVDSGAIAHLSPLVLNPDFSIKRQVLATLSAIAKHSVDLAELVVESEIFPTVLVCLKDPDEVVRKHCGTLIRDIAKHTPELSQLVLNTGGVSAIVDYVGSSAGYICLPGIMALGYISAHSETLAMGVIMSEGVTQIKQVLDRETSEEIHAACAWAMGQIGSHTPEHAKAVAKSNVLPKLLDLYLKADASEELKTQAKNALKLIIQRCVYLEALEPLLFRAPTNILKYTVAQFSKVLPHDAHYRKMFVTSGCLKKIQEMKDDCEILEYITSINNCYPEEVVRYYSPGYVETLMERVSSYQIPI